LNKAKLISNRKIAEHTFELSCETDSQFNFIPGQYISIKIDDKKSEIPCFRAYSISSIPDGKTFQLCIKTIENGRGSNWISALAEGSEIKFMGPMGDFTLKSPLLKNILFLAVGSGITPIKSIIESELKNGSRQNMHLIFGIRHIKGIFYKDFFKDLAKKYKNFEFTLALTQPESSDWKGKTGRTTEILKTMDIDPKNTSVYMCGLKEMIVDAKKALIEKDVPKENIFFENFN